MMADKFSSKGLSFTLTDEQMRALKPLVEATGKIKIAGEFTADNKLNISFIACNAAFIGCNASFTACNAAFLR